MPNQDFSSKDESISVFRITFGQSMLVQIVYSHERKESFCFERFGRVCFASVMFTFSCLVFFLHYPNWRHETIWGEMPMGSKLMWDYVRHVCEGRRKWRFDVELVVFWFGIVMKVGRLRIAEVAKHTKVAEILLRIICKQNFQKLHFIPDSSLICTMAL